MREQRIVFLETLPESKSGVEYEVVALDAGQGRGFGPLPQIALDHQHRIADRRQGRPLFRASAGVHQHRSDLQFRQGLRHLRIPAESAHVVDHFRAELHGRAGHTCLVGIDADHGIRSPPLQIPNHGQHSPAFLFLRDELRSGARRFATHIDDGCAFVEQMLGAEHGFFGIDVESAVGKGIGGYVDDAHDQSAPP